MISWSIFLTKKNKKKLRQEGKTVADVKVESEKRAMELLKAINSTGTTVLVVTHEHELARRYARRIIEMRHGVIVNDTAMGRAGV